MKLVAFWICVIIVFIINREYNDKKKLGCVLIGILIIAILVGLILLLTFIGTPFNPDAIENSPTRP